MPARTFASATILALFVFSVCAAATPPTRISFQFDETFPSDFLTDTCGIPVWIREQGAGTSTLHYDSGGQLVRELDTLAPGATVTLFSPLELGGTGLSFTDVTHSPSTFLYADGTDIGDTAIVILNGVQRTSGPGNPRLVGRQVFEGVIIDFTLDGVPVVDPVNLISESGQFDPAAVLQARCAALIGE